MAGEAGLQSILPNVCSLSFGHLYPGSALAENYRHSDSCAGVSTFYRLMPFYVVDLPCDQQMSAVVVCTVQGM